MEFGKAINYNITIEPTDNKGFTAKVGCGIFAFSNKEDLKEAFNEFLDDPKGFEEKYNAEHQDCITEGPREITSGSSRPSRGYGVTGHSQSVREVGSMGPDHIENPTGMTDRRAVDRGDDQNGMTERDDRGYLR